MEVLAAIPCYNCEIQITRVLGELDAILDECPWIKKVAVIDNRSKDQTAEAAISCIKQLKNRERFHVFRNTVNAGLGGTHKIAFSMAKKENFTHVLIVHGDHQATPADAPKLLQTSIENNEITVLGSRFRNFALLSGFSKVRIAGNVALNVFYTLGTGRRVSDLGSGLNLFKMSDINLSTVQDFDNGFAFNMDLLLYFIRNKCKFKYIPIHWSTSDQVSNVNAFIVGLKTGMKLIYWFFGVTPKEAGHTETEKIG